MFLVCPYLEVADLLVGIIQVVLKVLLLIIQFPLICTGLLQAGNNIKITMVVIQVLLNCLSCDENTAFCMIILSATELQILSEGLPSRWFNFCSDSIFYSKGTLFLNINLVIFQQ